MRLPASGVLACALVAAGALASAAQTLAPPAPDTPGIARDLQAGRATIRIAPAPAMRIDGRLEESLYRTVPPISDFVQMEPDGGKPATEKTDVWLAYDAVNVYVSVRAWESQPERLIANEMRRDSSNIRQGDNVGFSFDTFYDRRNAVQFEVGPLGGKTDGQSTNERQFNVDWNPVWDVATGTFEGGWTFEAAIPFKSLRYRAGAQTWGFQVRRTNKAKNEVSFLTPVPPSFGMGRGTFAASLYATVVGFDAPARSINLEAKPYGIASVTTDRTVNPPSPHDVDRNAGADVKYGITDGVTADFTYNTDFAQVEADEQQVNLTRFSLFFPEKREFFLENLGLFSFGGAGGTGSADAGDTPILFYSRRIGLSQGRAVPILGGGRLTGRAGRFGFGLINIQTREQASAKAVATNFSVLRVKRDVLRRSTIGAMASARSVAQGGAGRNDMAGLDGTFAFFNNLSVNTYLAKTWTDGLKGDALSYRGQLDYAGDRYGVQLERLMVGDHFNPEVGYLRRDDMAKSYGLFRFSPRPRSLRNVRKLSGTGTVSRIANRAGRLETRVADGEFAVDLQNSDRFTLGVNDDYEVLKQPFAIVPTVTIPAGAFRFATGRAGYNFGQQRPLSGNLLIEQGRFYDGDRTTLTFNRARLYVSPHLSFEPSASVNWVDLPAGSFVAKVLGLRVTYTVTPLMFTSAFVQFNSTTSTVSANVRFRWEYRPGSELFVVFNEERDTAARHFPETRNRSLVFKINRFFRL